MQADEEHSEISSNSGDTDIQRGGDCDGSGGGVGVGVGGGEEEERYDDSIRNDS